MFSRNNQNLEERQKPSVVKSFFNTILTILITVLVVFSGLFIWQTFFQSNNESAEDGQEQTVDGDQFLVTVDKTVIIQKVQSMQRLETVRQVIQRNVTVEVDLGDLEVFGVSLLENKRVQEFTITGYVAAGIELDQIQAEDVEVSPEEKQVSINLPAPKVFEANIIEDQTQIIREEITVLYNLETIDGDRRRELNEKLFQMVVSQSREALVQAACEDDILDRAEENADESMRQLFGAILDENFEVKTTSAEECKLASDG